MNLIFWTQFFNNQVQINRVSVNYKDVCQNWIACIAIDAMPRIADIFLAQHSSKSGFQLTIKIYTIQGLCPYAKTITFFWLKPQKVCFLFTIQHHQHLDQKLYNCSTVFCLKLHAYHTLNVGPLNSFFWEQYFFVSCVDSRYKILCPAK